MDAGPVPGVAGLNHWYQKVFSRFIRSELDVSATKAWQKLLLQAGLPQDGWSLVQLSKRDIQRLSQVTYLAEHRSGPRYTFRHQQKPVAPDRFTAHFNLQAEAFRQFGHSAENTMPEPVFLDSETQTSLLTHMEGRPLSDMMWKARDDRPAQLALLRRAGAWLDVFHRCQVDEVRVFNPRYTVEYYQDLRDKITSGRAQVAATPLFLQGIDHLAAIASGFEGLKTTSASQHGDFHMRNLIVSDMKVAGIDVSKSAPAPVGYDIAKLLLDYTSVLRGAADLRPCRVVPDDAYGAFFDGYTLVEKSDTGVRFLLFARVLATLARVPQKRMARSSGEQRTLRRLRPIARNAFG